VDSKLNELVSQIVTSKESTDKKVSRIEDDIKEIKSSSRNEVKMQNEAR
jgi:hypothetical protein